MLKDNIKYFRKQFDMTQEELAKAAGLKKSIICMYETGERKPSYEALEALCDVFNVNMAQLVGQADVSVDESKLLDYFRMATEAEKAAILAFAETIAKGSGKGF